MDDAELQAIRQARLAELKKNSGQDESSSSNLTSSVLSQLLEPAAKERLSRVNMVKPERAKNVEAYVTKLAQTGQLRRKMTESELVEILNAVARDEEASKQTKIVFDRKDANNGFDLSEDIEDDDDFFD